jgi:hypothetical protein
MLGGDGSDQLSQRCRPRDQLKPGRSQAPPGRTWLRFGSYSEHDARGPQVGIARVADGLLASGVRLVETGAEAPTSTFLVKLVLR